MKNFIFISLILIFTGCVRQAPTEVSQDNNDSIMKSKVKLTHEDSINSIGKKLFNLECAPCHAPTHKVIGGPFQRIRQDYGEKWTMAFIKNNESFRETGDIRSNYIYYKYGGAAMPIYPYLTDKEIILILDYVDSFPYVEEEYGLDFYSHRKISIDSMKAYIKYNELIFGNDR